MCAPHNEHGRVENGERERESCYYLKINVNFHPQSSLYFYSKPLGETDNKAAFVRGEHMFASLCRNRGSAIVQYAKLGCANEPKVHVQEC